MTAAERFHLHLALSLQRVHPPTLKVVCAYCDSVMTDGADPVSYGCCPPCAAIVMPEAEHG